MSQLFTAAKRKTTAHLIGSFVSTSNSQCLAPLEKGEVVLIVGAAVTSLTTIMQTVQLLGC